MPIANLAPLGLTAPSREAGRTGDALAYAPDARPAPMRLTADIVSLSTEARRLMAGAATMAGTRGTTTALTSDPAGRIARIAEIVRLAAAGGTAEARLADVLGTASSVVTAGGEGAVAGVAAVEYAPGGADDPGRSAVFAWARGSEGDDTISVAAHSADTRPGSGAQVRVSGLGGDDAISVRTNGRAIVGGGDGRDAISVVIEGPNGLAYVEGDGGDDAVSLHGSGHVRAGAGDDVIRLASDGFTGTPRPVASGYGGEGDDVIVSTDHMAHGAGGAGDDTIVGVGWAEGGAGDDLVALGASKYSNVTLRPGFGRDVVVLPDPAEGVANPGGVLGPESSGTLLDPSGRVLRLAWADANGEYSGDGRTYVNTPPGEDQAGHGLTHTRFRFEGVAASQIESRLDGTDLTLSVRGTNDSVLVRGWTPGRATFTFTDATGHLVASRVPPGLAVV